MTLLGVCESYLYSIETMYALLSSGVMCLNHWTDRPTASVRNADALLDQ